MTSVEPYEDGRFDIEVVGRQRMRLDGLDTSGRYLVGDVETHHGADPQGPRRRARGGAHPARPSRSTAAGSPQMRGGDVLDGDLPRDPEYLSYTPGRHLPAHLAGAPGPARGGARRWSGWSCCGIALREEMRAMRAIPSLPATEVARTSWSPN